MSRIETQLQQQPGYIGYLTAGDGGIDRTFEAALALVNGGVNILEIGVPFSDPIADGPVIQAASMRALKNGTTLDDIFTLIKKVKKHIDIPIILFTYLNPILSAGKEFYRKASEAGVDGCLVVDLPLEEATTHFQICAEFNIDPILLISPSTTIERINTMQQHAKGMLYYVCRKGTTGIKSSLPDDFEKKVNEIKAHTRLPVVVGFGISNQTMAKEILKYADGFVIGSLFVKAVSDDMSASELTTLAKSIAPS